MTHPELPLSETEFVAVHPLKQKTFTDAQQLHEAILGHIAATKEYASILTAQSPAYGIAPEFDQALRAVAQAHMAPHDMALFKQTTSSLRAFSTGEKQCDPMQTLLFLKTYNACAYAFLGKTPPAIMPI